MVDPLSSVTQRPRISDLSPKDPQFLILVSPKTQHFDYLTQTLISHSNWSQSFRWFIACGQLDVLYSINLRFVSLLPKAPRFTTLSLKDPKIFDLSPKDPLFFLVAPVIERPLCLRCLVALVRHPGIWVPPPPPESTCNSEKIGSWVYNDLIRI